MAVGECRAGGRPGSVPKLRGGDLEGGLADPQQAGAVERDGLLGRAGRDDPAVQGGAVGGAEVADGDPAVLAEVEGEVEPGDVRVVERDVGLAGAADPDLPAVQAVHAAGVGAADHPQLGGARAVVGVVGGRVGLVEAEHGAVEQRGWPSRVCSSTRCAPVYRCTWVAARGPRTPTAPARAPAREPSAVPTGAVTSTST